MIADPRPVREFEPLDTRDTAEQVVLVLVNSIRRAELEAGDRLPNIAELAEHLGVARDTVRSALQALAQEGVVEVKAGRYGGTVMRDHSGIPRVLTRILGRSLIVEGVWEDLIDTRLLLQTQAARLVSRLADPEVLARVERHLADMRRFLEAGERYRSVYAGMEIACAIAVHCGNHVIGDMLLRVIDRLAVIGVMTRTQVEEAAPEIAEQSMEAQSALVTAIRARDEHGIELALRKQSALTSSVVPLTRVAR